MWEWTISLSDGRQLGGAAYGDLQGRPVFLFHGQPGNRLFHPSTAQTREAGVRLIVPDRPGYGLSTFQTDRKLLDWPGDVLAIADHFGISQFDVIGFSGGGPFALACAYAIPEKLGRVCVVSGAPPMDEPEIRKRMMPVTRANYTLARFAGIGFELVFRAYWRQARRNPGGFVAMMARQAPRSDQEVLADPEFGAMLRAVWEENLRVDSRGYVYDARLLMNAWGFELEEISIPVELWWGEDDINVPLPVMEYFAERLLESEINILPDGGHFGLLTYWERILKLSGAKK